MKSKFDRADKAHVVMMNQLLLKAVCKSLLKHTSDEVLDLIWVSDGESLELGLDLAVTPIKNRE